MQILIGGFDKKGEGCKRMGDFVKLIPKVVRLNVYGN